VLALSLYFPSCEHSSTAPNTPEIVLAMMISHVLPQLPLPLEELLLAAPATNNDVCALDIPMF
jgi:hypothetical protein